MNTLSTTLTASEARINLYDMLEAVRKHLQRFVITHHGKPQAVVMPIEEVEGWEETLEILANKKLMHTMRQAEKDRKAGRVYSLEEVTKKLKLHEN